ncbi:MAG: hypothetical protein JRI36_06015 [Deltaproteobacteria bacterium]|nr:hypothetical protein [Deltaproteobacteria bacterium]
MSRKAGIKAVYSKIQEEWDEITAQARSSVLPGSIEDFIEELKDGSISEDSFSVLDCMDSCARCGTPILIETGDVVIAILDYYENQDKEDELYELIEQWRFDEGYPDGGRFCGYCEYQMSKDD